MLDHWQAELAAARRQCTPVQAEISRLRRAAWAYTTRRIPRGSVFTILSEPKRPEAGQLVLARVDSIGFHGGLQLENGRRKVLFEGDEIVVVYGNRYASNQFEAVVPETLGPCHLVAGGGVAAKARTWHAKIAKGPTQITPIGLLGGATRTPIRLRDFALRSVGEITHPCLRVVGVVGTGMDSGKTQTAAYLVKGLRTAGLQVGYAKITGTGAGGDTWLLKDAGADPVIDFTDAGFVSTYRTPPDEIERIFTTLLDHLGRRSVDAIVFEVADGVLQHETAMLLTAPVFKSTVRALLFTACDAMGAAAGCRWLRDHDLPIVGLGGILTASPLQIGEAQQATGLPAYRREQLAQARTAMEVLDRCEPPPRSGQVAWREAGEKSPHGPPHPDRALGGVGGGGA